MAKNSIGGFFVDLGLALDKQSFETGNKYLDGMTNGFNKLIGTARNASVVLATTAIAAGTLSSAELKTATLMGVATEKLDAWKAAASIAGVNVNGLVSSMGKLADVMNHVGLNGQGLSQYSKNLALLGMDVNDLLALDPADAYQKILETAQAKIKGGMKPTEVYAALQDVIGTEGTNLLTEINRKGLSVAEFLNGASATQFMTESQYNKGADFISEVKITKESLTSLSKVFGTELGAQFTNNLKDLNDWIAKNGDDIVEALMLTAKLIGDIANFMLPIAISLGKTAGGTVENLIEGYKKIFNGDIEEGFKTMFFGSNIDEKIQNYSNATGAGKIESALTNGIRSFPIIGDVAHATDWLMNKIGLQSDETYNSLWKNSMNDGIMRPDGTITRVAPDDWVFAARNIGDLAKAFIPQGMAGGVGPGTAQYSIVQNFTINGAKDLAQTIRQQAAAGVRDGLQFTMSNAGRNLQQMSGTR